LAIEWIKLTSQDGEGIYVNVANDPRRNPRKTQ